MHCLINTERPAPILYRHDFKAFKLYHMLSTYVLYILMKIDVCALKLLVSVKTWEMGIEFKFKAQT